MLAWEYKIEYMVWIKHNIVISISLGATLIIGALIGFLVFIFIYQPLIYYWSGMPSEEVGKYVGELIPWNLLIVIPLILVGLFLILMFVRRRS